MYVLHVHITNYHSYHKRVMSFFKQSDVLIKILVMCVINKLFATQNLINQN